MRGLTMGKFMPLHKGHLNMIAFALAQVDELIILVVSKDGECISGDVRVQWLKTYFENDPKVRIVLFHHQLPHDGVFTEEKMNQWCEAIAAVIPAIDQVFSSEAYGAYLARYIGAEHCLFDPDRQSVKISSTEIRKNPQAYYDFMPDCVRTYYERAKN